MHLQENSIPMSSTKKRVKKNKEEKKLLQLFNNQAQLDEGMESMISDKEQ